MTNYERIKSMSVEEMAAFMEDCHSMGCLMCSAGKRDCCTDECIKGHLLWLQREAEEDNGN